MAPEKPQQDAFLAAIQAKIAAWRAVEDTYRAAVSLDGPLGAEAVSSLNGNAALNGTGRAASDLPVGVFRDKPLKDAIPIYLGAGRRKQTNKEIAAGLRAGGFPTTSDNFESTVATALFRLKNDGVLLRFPDGWDLASSYPDSLRSRLEKDAKPRRTSDTKTKKAAAKGKPSAKAAGPVKRRRRTAADGPSIDEQIHKILMSEGPHAPAAFVSRFNKPANVVGLALGRMAKLGKAVKLPNGDYAAKVHAERAV